MCRNFKTNFDLSYSYNILIADIALGTTVSSRFRQQEHLSFETMSNFPFHTGLEVGLRSVHGR